MAQFGLSAEDALFISKKYTEDTIIGEGAIKGNPGKDGADGQPGEKGDPGENGKSAYDIWLDAGNTGTEEDFLESLKGSVGDAGEKGEPGESGQPGEPGRGIAAASVNDSGVLFIEYSDGTTEEVGVVKGADGTSVNILGDLTSTDELPDVDQKKGDGYLINGDLWVYTASVEPDAVKGFVNVGSIKGPAGNDGFSPTITPNPDNTDDIYKLDITTKDGTFTTPNLRGGDEVTKYEYMGTGNLSGETYYTYEDLSTKIGETVEVTVSNRYGESQDTLTIISKISDTELEVDNGAWIDTIMLTNTQTIITKIIDDARTSETSTWSSTKIKDELGNVFDNLTEEQKAQLKGADGKSAYQIWLDEGNTGSEEEFLESLKGDGADSSFVVTGAIDTDNPDAPVTLDQTFEEIKTAYDNNKTIVADILVAGEAQYIFNLLYVLEDAIAFEWINSAAKTGGQINLMSDNTASFTMTSLEGGGSGETYDDTEIRELVNGKQDATIFIDATMSTVKDSWDNYLLDVDEEYRYSKVQDMLVDGKTVVLRVKVDNVLVELPCVSYESYTNATLTFAAPYYNSSTEEKGLYIAFCASTVGWKLGIKVVKEASSTDMSPFIIKSVYTEDSDGFTVDTRTTTPALWADWYPAFEAGRPVYWDLHKNSIDSNTDVIRLYPHSHGVYYEATGTKECQFIGIGGYPGYDSRNDTTKYYYIGWFRSGSAPASNYKFVKRYKIDEIPKGGTTGQVLAKKSNTNGDVEWIDMTAGGSLVVTGNYSTDDDDNWTVSNIDKTFAEINEAITNNQNVVLKIYPEGDTINPYILYPAMHYANMGTAFSLMVSDTGQISGLSVMITADNQVVATRNEYDFEALKKSVSDGKTLVAGAITGKGIETAADAEFATMAENIGKIESNTPLTLKHSNITNTNFTNTAVCGNGVIVAFRDNLLYCSHNGGVTWKTTSLDMTNATNNCTMVYAEKHDIFIACISGMGIYTSYDGDNWTLRLSSTQANKLYYDTTTGICLAGSTVGTGSSGLWYSVNGYTWSSDSRQASKKVTYLGGAGGRLYAVIGGASHVSSDGYNWSTITAFSQYAISAIKYEQGLYMAYITGINQNQSWYYSYDGINFTQASVTFTGTTYGVGFNDMKRISTETWVVAIYTGIYYTTNRGKAWSVSNLGTSTGNWSFFAYKEKFYAGSCGGPGATYGGIQYSTDGKTWYATTGISGSNFKFYCVNDRLFASCSTGVYLLNSDGISWTQIIDISDIIYGDNDILITAGGSYSTNGIDWKDIDISNLDITSFNISKVYRCGSNLVVASTTSSNGMFYATLLK